jgi:hypothetical protein
MDKPAFDGGINVAVKIPLYKYNEVIRFYGEVLGLELTPYFSAYTGQSYSCRFGTLTLWLDCVPHNSQTDIWLELNTDDIETAKDYLSEKGVNFRPELERLPDNIPAEWISDPAGIVMILKEDERLKKQ